MFENIDVIITFSILFILFISFMYEKIPAHIAAITAMAAFLATGILSTREVLEVFTNSAPITIACLFIISASLKKTGVIDLVGGLILKLAEKNKILAIMLTLFGVLIVSAFMNNTPVVLVMTPIVITIARSLNDYPSKYLIPLSYTAILGGSCTLIGSSTNILVDGVATSLGQRPFGMFEISLAGICFSLVGIVFMLVIGRRLLPERYLLENEFKEEIERKKFTAEALVLEGSKLIGNSLNELQFSKDQNYEIIDLIRSNTNSNPTISFFKKIKNAFNEVKNKKLSQSAFRDIPLRADDRLIFKTNKDELIEIKKNLGITFDSENTNINLMNKKGNFIAEGMIGSNSKLIGKKPSELRLRNKYDCYILAIHKDNQNITGNFDQVTLKYGTVLLLEGNQEDIKELFLKEEILSITQVNQKKIDRIKAPISIVCLMSILILSALKIMPIVGLSIIAATIVVVTGCVKPQRAVGSIEWSILFLIFSMIALAKAMDKTGAIDIIVSLSIDLVKNSSPFIILAIIYLLTSVLTEIMSNNAAAILITPITIGIAEQIGIDPRPLIVAVMFGASASFATPIGYQTNTYVYNAGNYHFTDFIKVGLPMNILMLVVAVIVIPLIWKF